MTAEPIHYYLTVISPYVRLGHAELAAIASRHGLPVLVKPFRLAGVWESSGAVPLGQRPALRQRYRDIELQRWAEARDRTITLRPKHFPADPSLADLSVAALVLAGADPMGFVDACGAAVWAEDRNIAEEATVAALLAACGHDAGATIAAARAPEAAAFRDANTAEAVAAHLAGAPGYVYRGEGFWGQDRLELLERMIVTDRAPIFAS